MAAALALEDLLPVEHPGPVVLSLKGLAEVKPFLPARVVALVRSQLHVFQREVARPVTRAASSEQALARFEARMDVVGSVRLCLNRALSDSLSHSEALRETISGSARQVASRLKAPAYQLLGRSHGTLLLSTLRRASVSTEVWFAMAEAWMRAGAHGALITALTRPEYAAVATLARFVDGLLLVCVMALENDPRFGALPQARPLLQGLVERLWEAGLDHNRLALRWMLATCHSSRPPLAGTQELHQRLHDLSSDGWYFRELATEWRSATGHLSSPPQILRHPAYRRLLALQWEAVPFILDELARDIASGTAPWFWGPALAHITGEEPVYEPGQDETVEGVATAWLHLARTRGWKITGAERLDGATRG